MIGETLDGRYLIISLVGQGSMSVVYKAKHQLMKRTVAIKMLNAELANDPKSVERFKQEARAISSLKHENIVDVYDFGVSPEGHPFLVMDFVQGETLADLLRREQELSAQRSINIFKQACSALEHAHKAGVIHRDLKPTNFMILPGDKGADLVKLVDFGIAKLMDESGKSLLSLTTSGEIFSSPHYMSPEQCLGRPLDARADIYALGCVMFETLAGKPPFSAQTSAELVSMQVKQAATWPAAASALPPKLQSVIMKAISKDPDKRQKTMSDLANELDQAALSAGLTQTGSVSPPVIPLARPRLAWLLAAFTLLAAALGTWSVASPEQRLLVRYWTFSARELILPSNDPALAAETIPLADALENAGNYQAAARLYERYSPTASQHYGPKSAEMAEYLVHLASLQERAGKEQFAKQNYNEAIEILSQIYRKTRYITKPTDHKKLLSLLVIARRKVLNHNDVALGKSIYYLASCLDDSGQKDEAIRLYKEAVAILEVAKPLDTESLGWACVKYGRALNDKDKTDSSIKLIQRGISYLAEDPGEEHEYTVTGKWILGQAYMQQRKFQAAADIFRTVLALQKTAVPLKKNQVAQSEVSLAGALSGLAQYDECEGLVNDATRLNLELGDGRMAANTQNYLASIWRVQGKHKEATICIRRALELYRKSGPIDLADNIDLVEKLADSLRKQGLNSEADEQYAELGRLKALIQQKSKGMK